MNENKLNINWYPGHMLKATKDIKKELKLIDIVVEVLDSRIPISSQNHIIDEISKDKEKIVVLNKYDIADKIEVTKWKGYFEDRGIPVVLTNAQTGENINKLIEVIKNVGSKVYEKKHRNKSIEIKPIYRVLIVGIPNVGKSTIINKISKKKVVDVGNRPGVTMKKQWIRVEDNIELLDTPGLLWPRLENGNAGLKLALTGNIKQEILDATELAFEGMKLLIENEKYKKYIQERYNLNDEEINKDAFEIIELIGRKRGCLISGGNVDTDKASKLFLDDLKNGKIGNINLDVV